MLHFVIRSRCSKAKILWPMSASVTPLSLLHASKRLASGFSNTQQDIDRFTTCSLVDHFSDEP